MTILSNIAGWASNPTACCGCVLTVLGAIAAARLGWEVLSYVWLHALRPKTDLKVYGAKKGAWAVVTGCTNGIGEGFSHVLAQRGFNVVLVSRNEALLKPLAAGLTGKYGVKAEVIAVDCANATDADYARINASLKAVGPLSVVVNNVGVNRTETPNEFAAMTEDELEQMLEVNVRFHSKFTKLCIPLLQQRNATAAGDVAKRGAILHLSSFSGVFPAGLMSVYSATKSYADAFGRALHSELAGRKNGSIDSTSVVAHYVVSNMSGFDRPSMGVPTAVDFAKATLNKLGTGAQLVPHWHHDLMARIIRALPQSFVASKGYGMMQAVRKALTDPKKMEKRVARKAAAEAKKAEERKKFADAAAAGGKKDA